jgi:alginate O-acetyltransferase complex protein AlgI
LGIVLATSGAALILYAASTTDPARRRVLLLATLAVGLELSLRYENAHRLGALLFLASVVLTLCVFTIAVRGRRAWSGAAVVFLLALLVFVKWEGGQRTVYNVFRFPERYFLFLGPWLGLSYIVFRLVHVLLEARRGGLPPMRSSELLIYVLMPATLLAGPIDRFPRQRSEIGRRPSFPEVAEGVRRVVVGLFQKIVLADFLATLPLDLPHAGLSTLRMWASLYLFGLQIYFDFAGYSSIAIGSAALVGIRVPENFDSPYLKENLTRFWQSWHATLSGWMRDYVFFPLGRALRGAGVAALPALAVSQLATMIAIGLWHGLDARFALWGAWHAAGLFAAKLWADRRRGRPAPDSRWRRAGATFATFQYVMCGWVFFYAESVPRCGAIFARLAGFS